MQKVQALESAAVTGFPLMHDTIDYNQNTHLAS